MRVSYDESHCIDAQACLTAIRAHLEHGWQLVQVRGPHDGPFVAIFRLDDVE